MIITKKNVNEECTEPKTFGMLLKERIDKQVIVTKNRTGGSIVEISV